MRLHKQSGGCWGSRCKRRIALSAVAAGLVLSNLAWSESLWDRRDPRSAFLFTDLRARRVGDLLTVIINESTDIENRDKRDMQKQTRSTEVFQFKGKTQGNVASRQAAADLNLSNDADRQFQGKADYRADRRMADRITVEVVAVLPNGNLVVEGYRSRLISGEQRVLRLRGIVRPVDIASNNTVQSQFIGNLTIEYLGRGHESSYNDPNWWGRIMNRLWPF